MSLYYFAAFVASMPASLLYYSFLITLGEVQVYASTRKSQLRAGLRASK